MDLEEWQNKANQYDKVKVFQMDEKEPLGRCLNYAIDNSNFPYFSKCDDDNYYAPNFISDLMNAYKYTDAQIVGKLNYYCYLEGCQTLAMVCPNMEHRYVNMLSGSALIIDRDVFSKVRFSDKPTGSDTVFLKDCIAKGIIMYSADRFNYVYKRHKSQENHTWKMLDDVFLRSCKVIDITNDFVPRVTV
jgi:glycosyltransferase involved in cell wall biosynthesis